MSYPGHSTHLLQPLDVGLFVPLQLTYGQVAAIPSANTGTAVAKDTFLEVLYRC
jgi:hypothetical protein